MENIEITFNNLPQAVSHILKELGDLKKIMAVRNTPLPDKERPIGIDQASMILGKAKSTIYTLVQKRMIPCYKAGKKLYFYEHELLEWIANGRKKSDIEIRKEMENELNQGIRRKPKRLMF